MGHHLVLQAGDPLLGNPGRGKQGLGRRCEDLFRENKVEKWLDGLFRAGADTAYPGTQGDPLDIEMQHIADFHLTHLNHRVQHRNLGPVPVRPKQGFAGEHAFILQQVVAVGEVEFPG